MGTVEPKKKGTQTVGDAMEDITESSLPMCFQRPQRSTLNNKDTIGISSSTNKRTRESSGDSTNLFMQKEGSTDNIWQNVNTISSLRTQRNYDPVVTKRTIEEIEEFEDKIEEFVKDYRKFVDDGVTRKQPRF